MSNIDKIVETINPIPTIDLNSDNAVSIVKKASKKGMCYMKSMITPSVAEKLLTLEKNNRKRRKAMIKTYSRYMVIGKWKLCPDPITFDRYARLIDGGHSLASVVESNVPSFFTICTGAPINSKEIMDQIVPRSALDILGFKDSKFSEKAMPLHVATVRSMILDSPSAIKQSIPKLELAEFVSVYFDSVDKIIGYFGQDRFSRKLRASSIIAPVVRAYECYKDDDEKVKRIGKFIGILSGKIRSDKKEDDAAYALRDWILGENKLKTRSRAYKRMLYGRTEKCLDIFLKKITNFSIEESSIEKFPLNISKHENLKNYLDNTKKSNPK